MSLSKIIVQTNIDANKSKVWDYYTNPIHITQWNFASEEWCCPSAENDMRVGGRYIARMEAKDGSWGFDYEGTYDVIVDGDEFTYSLSDGRKVNISFEDKDDFTSVIVTFDPESKNPIEMQRDGWQAILNNFKKYVEQS